MYTSRSEILGLEQICFVVLSIHDHTPDSIIGSLSNDVFKQKTSTESVHFAILACDFEQIYGQIVSVRANTLSSTEWQRQSILGDL